ncbi:MAG: hypothetical protein J6A09_01815 [Alphaproteobacteria bacterium]|nr:hypothetical protein [Alphaproteobacteria bacterium]
MKKTIIITLLGLFLAGYVFYAFRGHFFDDKDVIYLNANDEKAYLELQKLKTALKKEGRSVVLSEAGDFKSGEINLYASSKGDELPKVLDLGAINFLWIERLSDMWALEKLKDFDVVVVKNYPLFSHLKAVNVRTAYIPAPVEIAKPDTPFKATGKAAYWGDADGFSLALYLAGKNDFSVDIYGKGFEKLWPKDEIKGGSEDLTDFWAYDFVLVDQSEEDIFDEVVNQKVRQILEGGGVPLVRYNAGLEKILGNGELMYMSDEDFANLYKKILSSPEEVENRRKILAQASQNFNNVSAAKKFIELFDIMTRKKI